MSLISYVQESNGEKSKHTQERLFTPRLMNCHDSLKRVQKINCINFMGFLLSITIDGFPQREVESKNEWMVRKTKIHKGLVIEIMEVIQEDISVHKRNSNWGFAFVEMIKKYSP